MNINNKRCLTALFFSLCVGLNRFFRGVINGALCLKFSFELVKSTFNRLSIGNRNRLFLKCKLVGPCRNGVLQSFSKLRLGPLNPESHCRAPLALQLF